MLTLVTGPDAFLVRSAVRRIRDKHDADGLNTSTLEAKSTSIEEITGALGTPGFFGASRVVIVNDLMTLSSKGSLREGEDGEPSERGGKSSVDWNRVFGAIQSDNIAVFVDRDMASVPAAVKREMPRDTEVVIGDPPRGGELIAWMKQRAAAAGSKLADIDARVLAELLSPTTWSSKPSNPAYDRPPDLDLFAGEIEKLALAALPGPIERSHIAEMTAAGQPDRLFPLIDAVISAEEGQAIRELSVAMGSGDEAGRIGAQLYQQAELLAALAASGRTDPAEVGRALGLSNPNRMIAISKSLQRMRSRPSRMLLAALETERQFKSGVLRQPADQVYSLVERSLALARQTREGGT
jgi:DNA polymerase III delta subunit